MVRKLFESPPPPAANTFPLPLLFLVLNHGEPPGSFKKRPAQATPQTN